MMSLFKNLFLIFTVVISCQSFTQAESNNNAPQLNLYRVGKRWKNITGKYSDLSSNQVQHSLYDEYGDDLFIKCTAPYPIRWRISGIIEPHEIVKIQTPKVFKNTFSIEIVIFFLEAEKYVDLAATASIACEEVGNAQNTEQVAVFVSGHKGSLVTPENTVLEGNDIALIPCPTKNPSSNTSLYIKNNDNSEILVEDVTYNQIEGFRLAESAKTKAFNGGTYVCKQNGHSVTFTVVQSPVENQFAPISDLVRSFSDEPIKFQCGSESKPVKLVFDGDTNNTETNFITDQEKNKIVTLTVVGNSISEQSILKGKVSCFAENKLIKEWSWEFIAPPKLYISNYEGEADCLSPFTPKIVQTVSCRNGMDCDFMGNCLHNATACGFKIQKQFYATSDTRCWVGELRKGFPCASVPFAHLNGLVKCGVMGMERQWEFFISLDYRRYINWKEAPLRELVRIEEIPSENSSIDSRHYKCAASAYLFADSLSFKVHYKNGTNSGVGGIKVTRGLPAALQSILDLNLVAILDKKSIPQDAVKLECIAPFWNSTETLHATFPLVF